MAQVVGEPFPGEVGKGGALNLAAGRRRRGAPAFQVQVHLVSANPGLVLVLTVTTPDPAREEQARVVAREVAATVRLVDGSSEVA